MLLNPQTRASTVGVSHDRISLEIEEHHCLCPDRPLMLGTDETGCGDDILNAWLPRDIDIKHVDVRQIPPIYLRDYLLLTHPFAIRVRLKYMIP